MKQSKFIQINDYLLLEYEYNSEKITGETTGGFILSNNRINWNYFFNGNSSGNITKNVLDTSCLRINTNTWVSTDIDIPTPWINYDSNISINNLTYYGREYFYDKIKLHIVAGYNLENNNGIIVEVASKDRNNKPLILSSKLFQKENYTDFEYNKRPIYLGERFYDKCFSWLIPSLNDLSREWQETSGLSNGILYQLTNTFGILENSLIDIGIYEISNKRIENNNFTYFENGRTWNLSLQQQDEFYLFHNVIEESQNGDYYQYYATYNDSNIFDWINEMKQLGEDWVLIHDISVWEQIENTEIKTSSFSSFQDSNFELLNYYRPIIINDSAYSFTIEYVCRLLNRKNNSQIIRKSSISSLNTKKYNKNLSKLNIIGDTHKIYNKLIQTSPIKLNPIQEITKIQNIYYPLFIEKNNIIISGDKLWIDENENIQSSSTEFSTILYPQGELKIFLSPFDNILKFKIYEKS